VVPQKENDDRENAEDKDLQPLESLEKYVIRTKSYVNGVETNKDVLLSPEGNEHWDVEYNITNDSSPAELIKTQFHALRKMQADIFGPSDEAGANTFMDRFRKISDQYLNLERVENERQLIYGLLSRNLDEVSNAWKELQSSKEFAKHKLRYLTSRVLEALEDNEIETLVKEYSASSTYELQELASINRCKVIEEHLQDGIKAAPTYTIRRVSQLLGLRSVLPRPMLEKQLEKIMNRQQTSEETAEYDHKDAEAEEPKLSLSQRLKQRTQASVSNA
jgi:hypothetical protein